MTTVFVQFASAAEDKVMAVFGCPQDPEYWPNLGEIEDDDPRYLAFMDPTANLTATQLSAMIDTRIADIYATWTRFEAEYLFREAAAIKFRDAGYTGDAGIWIEAFADAAGLGLQVACDLILSQSANLRAAQEALGALRMRKYEIAPLTGAAAAAKYDEICAAITLVASQIS